MLIDKAGANLEIRDHADWTALMWAAFNGHRDAVEVLVSAGADQSATADGKTAQMLALDHGHADVAQLLAKRRKVSSE